MKTIELIFLIGSQSVSPVEAAPGFHRGCKGAMRGGDREGHRGRIFCHRDAGECREHTARGGGDADAAAGCPGFCPSRTRSGDTSGHGRAWSAWKSRRLLRLRSRKCSSVRPRLQSLRRSPPSQADQRRSAKQPSKRRPPPPASRKMSAERAGRRSGIPPAPATEIPRPQREREAPTTRKTSSTKKTRKSLY